MKTLREYIDLIDGKLTEAPDLSASGVAAIIKAAMQTATGGGFAPAINPNKMLSGPNTPVSEVGKPKRNKFDQSKSLVDFTDSDKYDNFVAPDDDEAEDYKAGIKGRKRVRDAEVYNRNGFADAAVSGLVGSN
jgi:hypothetical protein